MNMNTSDIPLYELYDIWYKPFWKESWFIALCGIVGLLVCSAIILFVYKKLSKKNIEKDPWQEALDGLYSLDIAKFDDGSEHRVFYFTLTAILKKYIIKRYGVALEATTDQEFLVALEKSNFPRDLLAPLQIVLENSLTIKFAHQEAVMEQMRFDVLRGIDIVRNTIPNTRKK